VIEAGELRTIVIGVSRMRPAMLLALSTFPALALPALGAPKHASPPSSPNSPLPLSQLVVATFVAVHSFLVGHRPL
jgi:hypothetical protein